jgi:hypothetical protein
LWIPYAIASWSAFHASTHSTGAEGASPDPSPSATTPPTTSASTSAAPTAIAVRRGDPVPLPCIAKIRPQE